MDGILEIPRTYFERHGVKTSVRSKTVFGSYGEKKNLNEKNPDN